VGAIAPVEHVERDAVRPHPAPRLRDGADHETTVDGNAERQRGDRGVRDRARHERRHWDRVEKTPSRPRHHVAKRDRLRLNAASKSGGGV
jgi:hypothetical protein